MEEELGRECADIAFMTNLVYDRGVALEYDLLHDRLEDAERRLADLEDMIPQVYGLTELTTPEERLGLVRALGKVRQYIQEGNTLMGQGAADGFNASLRTIMWNIIVRCREMTRQMALSEKEPPWMRPKEVVEHGSYVIFTNLDTGETKQYFTLNPPDSEGAIQSALFIEPFLEEQWGKNLKFDIVPAERLPPERPGRPFPQTYGDWVDLAEDIKTHDPGSANEANNALTSISHEDEAPHEADAAKRWLVRRASELGIK